MPVVGVARGAGMEMFMDDGIGEARAVDSRGIGEARTAESLPPAPPVSHESVQPIESPPGYEDHDPYTGLPPGCAKVPGGYMMGTRFIRHVRGTSRVP